MSVTKKQMNKCVEEKQVSGRNTWTEDHYLTTALKRIISNTIVMLKSHIRSDAPAIAWQGEFGRIGDNISDKSEICRRLIGASADKNSVF